MKLIENWRRAHRMLSVQAMALAAAVQGAWPTLPEEMKSSISPTLVNWISLALLVAGIVGRLVQQNSTEPAPPKDQP